MPFDREIIEARLALKMIPSVAMPQVAIEAFEAGLDGPGIRRLAVLEQPTYFQVAEVLPRASQEMGLKEVSVGEASLRLVKMRAKEILRTGEDPRRYSREFELIWINAGYPPEIQSVGNLDDEIWIAESYGQSEKEIREWITQRLKDFVG